ncbi:MAG: GNAT family N-acetyltransferase [Deltaproteobacteria bacterium]|nr:GNAT family N-acetyltransferase [Deltaproteobacteria bacterium]
MNITIRPMRHSDVPAVIELAQGERWYLQPEDLQTSMDWTPTGCLAAESDGRLVGFVTSFLSDGVGWWGNLLVHPEERGRGTGRLLIRRVTEELEACNARTLIVVAARGREGLYRQFDFIPFQDLIMWVGPSSQGSDPRQVIHGEKEIHLALALDEQAWNFSRRPLLMHLARRRELISVPSPYAFLMHEPVKRFQFVGPWEACGGSKEAAGELLKKLFGRLGPGAFVFLKSPADNFFAAQILAENGFTPLETETMMYRGRPPGADFDRIYAIATGGASG